MNHLFLKNQLIQMAYSSVNKKTASTILKFAEKLNNKSGEAIRISRNDLASVAGIATETLIRTLSSFKNAPDPEQGSRHPELIGETSTVFVQNLNKFVKNTTVFPPKYCCIFPIYGCICPKYDYSSPIYVFTQYIE